MEEMKVRHYVRMMREWVDDKDIADRDYLQLLNILIDGNFKRTDTEIWNDITIMNCIGWVIIQPFKFDTVLPKVLEFKGGTFWEKLLGVSKIITIPRDPSELSIGQNIHLRRDFIDKSQLLEENISIAVAIYLQPLIDGKFQVERAKELAREIDEMPISLIYPIGFFLLRRVMTFGMKRGPLWQQILSNLSMRLNRMWPGSRKSTSSARMTI